MSLFATYGLHVFSAPQQIASGPVEIKVQPGTAITLPVTYTTSDNNELSSGLGLRLHFDSRQLTWQAFDQLYTTDLMAQDTEPQNDASDFDGDPQTDKFVQVAWASVAGAWPGSGKLPLRLYHARFQLSGQLSGATRVNFSASSTAAGYTLAAQSSTISPAPAPVTPAVSVTASDPNAAEAGAGPGRFVIARTGDTASALLIHYLVSGTAASSADFVSLPGSMTIAVGAASATIDLVPIDDIVPETTETVVVTLKADTAYQIGAPNSATITISDNDPSPSFVSRLLPPAYAPSARFTVTLQASPPADTVAYGVEEAPPAGWTVANVTEGGEYDAVNHKVKWTFLDKNARTLSYQITPAANATGTQAFNGEANVNGSRRSQVGGNQTIEFAAYHPADDNPKDWTLRLSEVLRYATAYKRGDSWLTGPNPIQIGYVIRGFVLYKKGEKYRYDSSASSAPGWWVTDLPAGQFVRPGGAGEKASVVKSAAAQGQAVSQLPAQYAPNVPFVVTIAITPPAGGFAYGVEDQVPAGWTVSNMNEGGEYDAVNRKVKWTFLDNNARSLTYQVTPSANATGTVAFAGIANFDGVTEIPITGQRQTTLIVNQPTNVPPNVAITAPATGAIFTAPASITIEASTSDADGTVTQVEFFDGTTALGIDTSPPFSFTTNLAVGTHTMTARATDNRGDSTTSATVVVTVRAVGESPQTITFAELANRTFGDTPFELSASASSGLTVTFTIRSGPATLSTRTLTLTGAGLVTVRASQAGDASYEPAPEVDRTFIVAKAGQTISFESIGDQTFGDSPFAVQATASSGLPVAFSIVSGPATIVSNIITLTGVGPVTVRAVQNGNTNYRAAPVVERSFNIASPFTVAGLAFDGYLARATVFLDRNGNARLDTGEPFAQTDSHGAFSVAVTLSQFDTNRNGRLDAFEGKLVVTGGVDIATGLSAQTTLAAPANATVVNPLTTLLVAVLERSPSLPISNAEAALKASLQISPTVDVLHHDPMAAAATNNPTASATVGALAKIQNTALAIAACFQTDAAPDKEQIAAAVMDSMAEQVLTGGSIELSQAQNVQALMDQAARRRGVILDSNLTEAASQIVAQLNAATDAVISSTNQNSAAILGDVTRIAALAQGEVADTLAALSNGSLQPGEATARFTSDALHQAIAATPFGDIQGIDTRTGTFAFGHAQIRVAENGRLLAGATVARTDGNVGPATLIITVNDGSATRAGADYTTNLLRINFVDRQIVQTIDLRAVIINDGGPESDETVQLSLALGEGNSADARLGVQTNAIVTIVDDDTVATRPRLLRPERLPDRKLKLTFGAEAGRTYTLEASTNLVDWLSISEAIGINRNIDFIDTNASGLPRRFYRIMVR